MAACLKTKDFPGDFRQEFLMCSICADPFNREGKMPKCLPCLHCFCVACLNHLVAGVSQIQCPKCRKECKVPEIGAEGFVTNFNVENLKEYQYLHEIGRDNSVTQPHKCTLCKEENSATGYCYDCEAHVCQTCSSEHQTSRFLTLRSHKIVSLAEYQRNSQTFKRHVTDQICDVHVNKKKVLTLFCRECQMPICDTCGITKHKQHDLQDLEMVINEATNKLQELGGLVKNRQKPIEDLSEVLEAKINEISTLCSQKEKQIDETFDNLQTRIHQRQAQSKKELREVCLKMTEVLKEQKCEVDSLAAQFSSAFDFADQTNQIANPVHFFSLQEMVSEQLKILIDTDTNVPKFAQPVANSFLTFPSHHEQSLQNLYQSLSTIGKMVTSSTVAYLCQVDRLNTELVVNTPQYFAVRAINGNREQQKEGGDNVTASLEAADGTETKCMVEDSNNGMYAVGFTPTLIGNCQLKVHIFGKHIKGSPFQLNITEDSSHDDREFVGFECPTVALVGHPHEVLVNLSKEESRKEEARVDRLQAEIKTHTGDKVQCQVKIRKDGQFGIQYTPLIEGTLCIYLTLNGVSLPDNPYTVDVSPVSPKATIVSFEKPIKNQKWTISITPLDYRQREVAIQPKELKTRITNIRSQKTYILSPTRNENGTYECYFVPRNDAYIVRVLLYNISVTETKVEVLPHLEFKPSNNPQSFPTGIATGSRNITYVSDTKDGKIHALKFNGLKDYQINLPVNQTSQIAVDDQGRLLLLYPRSKVVSLLDQQGNELNQWHCEKKNSRPVTLSSTKEGRVVIADAKVPSMFIYKLDGTLLAKEELPADSIVDGINNICVDAKNRIVLAHHKEPVINFYDSEGQHIHQFKSGATSPQLAVAATTENVLLLSQPGQIRVFNDKQELISEIPIVSGHIFTNLACTHDCSFMGLDVGQKQLVKYGYKMVLE